MIHRPSVDNVPIPLRRTESSTFSKQVINAQITIGFPVYLNVYHLTAANYFIQIFRNRSDAHKKHNLIKQRKEVIYGTINS